MTRERLRSTLRAFDDDWERLAEQSKVPPGWWVACADLDGAETLRVVLDRARARPDSVLLGLIALHQSGESLAGRVVLQAMIPKAVHLALRDRESSLADVLAELWLTLSTYPVARRPRRVAANLALDTLKAVVARRDHDGRVPGDPSPTEPGAERVLALAAGLGVIDAVTYRTLACVYVQGRSSRAAAQALGMSGDVVRWRCSRGVRALRAARQELADAWAV